MAKPKGKNGSKKDAATGVSASAPVGVTTGASAGEEPNDVPRRRNGAVSGAPDRPGRMALAPGVKYRRILLKLSGEALQGQSKFGIDQPTLAAIADELIDVHGLGVEIALVIGGGNIFRGGSADRKSVV